MKKIYSLGLAALALLAVSCVNEDINASVDEPDVTGKFTIVAEMEQSTQTRTTVEQEGAPDQYKVKWAKGDKISVFAGTMLPLSQNKEFTLTDGAGTTTGKFTGNLNEGDNLFFAIYPYNPDHNIMGDYVIPSVYGDVDTEYTPNTNAHMMANLMAAGGQEEGAAPKLSFQHLGGVLALDLYGIPANVKGVVLTANQGIAGKVIFNDPDEEAGIIANGALYATDLDKTNNSITIYFKPKETVRSEVFYFPLPVGTYQFKVEYIDSKDNKILVIDSKKDNIIKRAGLLTMPELTVAPLAKISVSDETLTDAKVSIEIAEGAGDFAYFMQSFGKNVANMTETEFEQKLNDTMLKNAVSSKNLFSDGKYETANGSLLAWYKAYMEPSSAKLTSDQTVFVALVPVLGYDGEGPILDPNHIIYELVTLKGYTISEDATANVAIAYDPAAQTTTQMKATLTPGSGTSFRYTGTPLTQEQYDAVKDDNAAMLKKFGTSATAVKTAKVDFSYGCSPGQTLYLLVHAFDSVTGEGKIQVQTLESPKVTYNEGIILNLEVWHAGFRYADVKIEATGGELKQIRWGYMKKSAFESNATLKANGTELEKMMEIAEEQLAVDKIITQRGLINSANLVDGNLYSIENMYYEEDTYVFAIGYDSNDVPTHMDYELIRINKADPLEEFDASLAAPTVKNVYYIVSLAGYKMALSDWKNMNTVTDVTTLDASKGSYWLDLEWGEAGEPKRMWLSSDDNLNNPAKGLITGDAKHDALEVLKKRSGSTGASGTAPDYYGRSKNTGALSLTGILVTGASENNKYLRNVITGQPVSPKTLFLVWETTDGKYGYMTVTPENYIAK